MFLYEIKHCYLHKKVCYYEKAKRVFSGTEVNEGPGAPKSLHWLGVSLGFTVIGSYLHFSLIGFSLVSLHRKRSFSLRIYLVNVTKSAVSCGFGRIYGRNP